MLDSYTEVAISKHFEQFETMECDQVFSDGTFKTIICKNKYEVFEYVNNSGFDYQFYMPI